MASSSIELKVLYAHGLSVYNYFQKPVVFVQVSLAVDEPGKKLNRKQQQIQRTTTVREDEGSPEWNQEMRFDLTDDIIADRDHLFVQFDLRHEGLVFGDKPIGEIRVPFTDLIEGSTGIVRFVSYEVRTPEGKPNGALNFSYKVNLKDRDLGIGENSPATKVSGYPVLEHEPYLPYPALGSADYAAEMQYSTPAGAPYPSRDHEVYYPPTETTDGYYPPGPAAHAAVVHHHHHGPPPPPPHRVHPSVTDPRRYPGWYDYGPRRWGPGSGPWASWNGR